MREARSRLRVRKILRVLPIRTRHAPLHRRPLLLRGVSRRLRLQDGRLTQLLTECLISRRDAVCRVFRGGDGASPVSTEMIVQITTASLYSPYTFRIASEISPTVAFASTAASIRGIKFSPE